MAYEVVISIINYRTGKMTIDCVQSVLAELEGIDGMVVVVDNLSADGSAEKIEDWMATQGKGVPAKLVRSETNSGFSGGHNQGMAVAEADFYLLLNSDAVLQPGALQTLLQAARADPGCGFFAPVIQYEDGRIQDSCFRFHTPASELIRAARSSIVTRLLRRYEVSLGSNPDPSQICWASFACILLSGEMVRAIGPMDEGYFLYFEDVEYCLRGHRAGWRIQQHEAARVVHFRGGSGPVKSLVSQRARLPRYYYSSRTRYFYQAYGRTGLISANLLWYLGRVIKHLTRFAGRSVKPMVKSEARDIWTNVLNPLGSRFAPWEVK